jgi:Flp pilus assembly protein TadD
MGLAKVEEGRQHYAAALLELDQAIQIDSGNASAHYLRGQVLMRMGRKQEGRQEYATATKIMNQQPEAGKKELGGESVPSPELAREPE